LIFCPRSEHQITFGRIRSYPLTKSLKSILRVDGSDGSLCFSAPQIVFFQREIAITVFVVLFENGL
jgi:hypothetical protein